MPLPGQGPAQQESRPMPSPAPYVQRDTSHPCAAVLRLGGGAGRFFMGDKWARALVLILCRIGGQGCIDQAALQNLI